MTKEMLRGLALATVLVARIAFGACGDGVVDSGEECDLGPANGTATSCCTTLCEFRAAGNTCRAVAGPCDMAETCTGTSDTCPADGFKASNVVCRPVAGACDVAETCSGTGPNCPGDSFQPAGTVCRAASGICDVAEFCDGNGPTCPADGVAPAGTQCRAATGDCDLAESCDGSNPTCPPDGVKPTGTVCRASAGTCDQAETCDGANVACPPDAFAPDGTACNDGSPCTNNDACFRGACVGTTSVDSCLDDFVCYKTKASVGEPKFVPIDGVHLVDQFQDIIADLTRPRELCLPADDHGQGTVDPATHLQAYAFRAETGSPRFTSERNILVTNQLGFIRVDTLKPDLLLVPAAKSLTGPPPPAPDSGSINVDHYECYKVHVTAGTPRFPERVTVPITDQFNATTKTMKLKKPRHLCTPVEKNGEPVKNPSVHLMCYLAHGTPKTARHTGVFVTDQFGSSKVDTSSEREICIPSLKTLSSPSGAFLDDPAP
jgi:hypothetical protein